MLGHHRNRAVAGNAGGGSLPILFDSFDSFVLTGSWNRLDSQTLAYYNPAVNTPYFAYLTGVNQNQGGLGIDFQVELYFDTATPWPGDHISVVILSNNPHQYGENSGLKLSMPVAYSAPNVTACRANWCNDTSQNYGATWQRSVWTAFRIQTLNGVHKISIGGAAAVTIAPVERYGQNYNDPTRTIMGISARGSDAGNDGNVYARNPICYEITELSI